MLILLIDQKKITFFKARGSRLGTLCGNRTVDDQRYNDQSPAADTQSSLTVIIIYFLNPIIYQKLRKAAQFILQYFFASCICL